MELPPLVTPEVSSPLDESPRSSAPESDSMEVKQFVPPNTITSPEEQNEFGDPNKTSSGEEQKIVAKPNENNSKNNSDPELFAPSEPAPQADVPAYKKKGKIGRQRKYEELGNDDIEPVREVVLLMHHTGQHWPGMSKDMQTYYDYWYFTKPNKRKDGKDYDRHLKCWERKERWINPAVAPV